MAKKLFIEAGSIAEKNMSGVGHTALSIVRELAQNTVFTSNFTITLLVPFNKTELVKAHDLPDTVKIRKIYIPGKIMNGLVRFNLVPYMDILFGTGTYLFPNFKNWPLLRSKSITYIHDVYFKIAPEHIESKNLDLLEKHTGRFIGRADTIITVSNHAKSEIETYFPESMGKIEVVHNGVDHNLYYPRSTDEQELVARKYDVVVGSYFVFFSNIEPRKNVDTLLDAYKLFVDEKKQKEIALLLIGGMGWANEGIITKMKELEAAGYKVIKPPMYVPDEDIPALLTGAISLIHPAVYEGFGLTPLEAMACGSQVVVGDNSSLPEVMGADYNDYVDVTNPETLKSAMIHCYDNPKFNQYGVERARVFSWKISAERLAEIIRS